MKKTKNIAEPKKEYRIVLNFQHPKTGVTVGAGEPIPTDLTETEIQDLVQKGNICPVGADGENVDLLHKDSEGRMIMTDAEIMGLRPNSRTLNFLKKNRLCKNSLLKLKSLFDEAAEGYGIKDNFFINGCYQQIDDQLKEVAHV